MSDKYENRKAYGQIALTALCAAGLFSVLYWILGFYPFGDGSIVITDLYSQYVPLLYRFYDVVTGQKNLFLDFSVSGGANLYADTVNEVVNPFNYVLFLFGRDRLYQAVNILLFLYVTASAASADFFLLKMFPQKRRWNVVLSLCYSFSGYMAYNYQIIKWMYFPVLFPLFCLALRRLLREKKGGWYAVLLGYQLVLSIQLGFMTLLFVLFAGGICFWGQKDRRAAMCRLGVYTAIGLLLSGAVLLPNIQILLSSSRAGENLSYFGVMKRHGLDDLFERLFQIAQPVLLSLLVWAFAGWRRGRKKAGSHGLPGEGRFLFLLNGFLWLTVLFQPANLLWHMGSYVCFPVRYGYMVLLAEICLTKWLFTEQEEWADRAAERGRDAADSGNGKSAAAEKQKAAGIWLAGGAAALCMAACLLAYFWGDRVVQAFSSLAISLVCPKETLVVCVILLLFFAAGLCSLAGGKGPGLLPGVTALCGLCLYLFLFLPPDYGVRLSNEAAYRKMTQQADAARRETGMREQGSAADRTVAQRQNPDVLNRVKDDPELPLNAALVNRTNSLTGYFPTASQSFQNAMESLGYLVPWVATQSVGGTAVSDAVLSMGLLIGKEDLESAFQRDSVLGRQQELAALAGGDGCFFRIPGDSLETGDGGAALVQVKGAQTIYLDPAMTANAFRIFANGEEVEVPEPDAAFSSHRIVEVGNFADETVAVLVTDKNGSALSFDGMEFGVLDREKWTAALAELRTESSGSGAAVRQLGKEELEISPSGGSIRVSIADAEEGQTVFLPFAALSGWDCVLNGETVDIASVFGGFMGITAQAGVNEIRLKFLPPGLQAGIVLTVCGVAALPGGAVFGQSCRKRKVAMKLEAAVSALYRVLFAAGLLVIYGIPAAGFLCWFAGKVLGIW